MLKVVNVTSELKRTKRIYSVIIPYSSKKKGVWIIFFLNGMECPLTRTNSEHWTRILFQHKVVVLFFFIQFLHCHDKVPLKKKNTDLNQDFIL